MDTSRVWADIDLDALGHNLGVIRRAVGPAPALLLVVKADAYGHGAVAVAHHALRSGAQALGVGTSAEALELRRAGIRARILVLGTIVAEEVGSCVRHGIEIGLHATDRARALEEAGRVAERVVRVHLNVDTGMGRLGVLPRRAADVLRVVQRSPHVELAGVMTHLAAVDEHDPSPEEQLRRFERVLASARGEGLIPASAWVHAANSLGIFRGAGSAYDAVRPGLAAFGVGTDLPTARALQPVLSWRTQVVFLKDLPAGSRVGYGGAWTASRDTRVATLPVGYNDGLAWSLGNRAEVLVRGRRAPLIGRVSMDYATVDVTDVPGVAVGDTVTLLGRDAGERIRVEELAERAGTIPHEITCRVGQRVGRVYRGGDEPAPGPPPERAEGRSPTRPATGAGAR
ncbi:MAG: alanine racemase [Planctomycetota bacterium]